MPGVYGLFNSKGECIYVGGSANIGQRIINHYIQRSDQAYIILDANPAYVVWERESQCDYSFAIRELEVLVHYKKLKQAKCNLQPSV